ncbi:MAG: hypothetical protein LBH28_08480 [Oscillospiraceae bacterium]|jgi:hypothetical protein|nr:hypothetical protein [Oscillospiraceae bacterium]
MSTKRILRLAAIAVLLIAAVIGAMLLISQIERDNNPVVQLPKPTSAPTTTGDVAQDSHNRVEVTTETVQAVVETLSRPESYSRDIIVESYWEGGNAAYNISVSVADGITALKVLPTSGDEKRIIVTSDFLYVWYIGDKAPYVARIGSAGDGLRTSDEWQKLVSYEDLLELDPNDIIEAGYVEFGGENCVYAEYASPLLGNTGRYYISVELGLLTGAVEHDKSGTLIYSMTSGKCTVGKPDASAFALPNGDIVE